MQMTPDWQIDVLFEVENPPFSTADITAFLMKCLAELQNEPIPHPISHLSILFVNDNKIQKLNNAYRMKDSPTDVLSFSQIEQTEEDAFSVPPEAQCSLGDIVISLDTAQRQAVEQEVSFIEETHRLLVHGLLHLFGYDHEGVPQEEADAMFRKQDEVLRLCTTDS